MIRPKEGGCHASTFYPGVSRVLPPGELFRPLHPGIDRPANGWTSIPRRNRLFRYFKINRSSLSKEAVSITIIHEYGSPLDPPNDDMMQNAGRV
jgi:hypothetical protein